MNKHFPVGTRVRLIRDDSQSRGAGLKVGDTGIVKVPCALLGGVGVDWGKELIGGHDLGSDGGCKYGHGWYVDADWLEAVDEEAPSLLINGKRVEGVPLKVVKVVDIPSRIETRTAFFSSDGVAHSFLERAERHEAEAALKEMLEEADHCGEMEHDEIIRWLRDNKDNIQHILNYL